MSVFSNRQRIKSVSNFQRAKRGINAHVPRNPTKINEVSQRFSKKYGENALSHDHPLSNKSEEPAYLLAKADEIADPVHRQLNAPKQPDIKFVSAVDSKPIVPAFIKLLSLQDFIELQKSNEDDDNGNGEEGGIGLEMSSNKNKKQQLAKKMFNIQKDENWDMIRAGEFIESVTNLAGEFLTATHR